MEKVQVFQIFCHTCGTRELLYLPVGSRRVEPDLPDGWDKEISHHGEDAYWIYTCPVCRMEALL